MKKFRSFVALPAALTALLGMISYGARAASVPDRVAGAGRSPVVASTAGPAGASAQALPAGRAWTVTLVTGDVVGVRTVRGKPPLVTVRPGPGRKNVIFSTYTSSRGQIEVLPGDVTPLVGTLLDPALFDVTTLIQNGDDDAHRPYLPLIVQVQRGTNAPAAARSMSPAFRLGTALPSIGAVAVHEPRATAPAAGQALARVAASVVRMGGMIPRPSGGITHIWLDRTVVADALAASRQVAQRLSGPLDPNLVQIGAPVAWRAGDTGRGIRVAVLDTGVDATHPDLRGQIVAEKNFSSSRGVTDRFGHGTFVAAQVAGTGAAADGERRGVAFGAKLVIGKVLGDDGTGLDSAVIAGMQWAATRARVISMSLGSFSASDGTDPVSEAVNRLTAADHVLFVIAAGNSGPFDKTVGSPGAATDALTVGAVDGGNRLAFFSSRGPRIGDFAIKPEITAPGVNIVGARAAGTAMGSLFNSRYVIDSGTSMATPQVAGAAAILAALHPRWSPAALKAALVSTAHRATGGDLYEAGGGVLDIGAAVTGQVVSGQAVADLGAVRDGSVRPVTDRLSWTSTAKAATTVELSAELTDHFGRPAPAGVLRFAVGRLRIAAGGSASALVTLHPGPLAGHPGLYEGEVLARDGGRVTRTPVSLYLPPPTPTLTLRATPLPGSAVVNMAASAIVLDTTDPDVFGPATVTMGPDGTTSLQVPAGHYWVLGTVFDQTNPSAQRAAITGQPDVTVTRNTTVTLDGSAAVPVSATVTGHATRTTETSVHVERAFAGQTWAADLFLFSPVAKLYGQPSGTASTGTFHVYTALRLVSTGRAAPAVWDLYHAFGNRFPASLTYDVTPAQQATLARVSNRFYAVDGNTSPMLENRYGLTQAGFLAIQNTSELTGGSTRTDYVSTEAGISWTQDVSPPFKLGSGLWVIEVPGFQHYAPGSVQAANWAREPFRPGPYSATQVSVSFCAPQPVWRSRGNIHVELVDLQDLPDGFDCLGGAVPAQPWMAATSRAMRLYRNGRLIASVSGSTVADFLVPTAAASYKLTYADNTSAVLPVSTRTSTTWTFPSAAPTGLQVRIPLLLVGYDLPLNLNNHPDGSTAVLSVAPVAGTPASQITGMHVWTSTDNGRTWQAASVRVLSGTRFSFTLPHAKAGQAVSLRVRATDAARSGIDQTIIAAYHA